MYTSFRVLCFCYIQKWLTLLCHVNTCVHVHAYHFYYKTLRNRLDNFLKNLLRLVCQGY